VKLDRHARKVWGRAYGAIPKSVFATLAFHLADAASLAELDGPIHPGIDANHRYRSELRAIRELEHLKDVCSPGQAERAIKSIHDYLSARTRAPNVSTEGK
jgi:hypothetical protein